VRLRRKRKSVQSPKYKTTSPMRIAFWASMDDDGDRILLAVKEGWRGHFFENFEVGDIYELLWDGRSPLQTTSDSRSLPRTRLRFTLTMPTNKQSAGAHWSTRLLQTVALVTGRSVAHAPQNVFANLGWDEVRLRALVFEGDTVYSQSVIRFQTGV